MTITDIIWKKTKLSADEKARLVLVCLNSSYCCYPGLFIRVYTQVALSLEGVEKEGLPPIDEHDTDNENLVAYLKAVSQSRASGAWLKLEQHTSSSLSSGALASWSLQSCICLEHCGFFCERNSRFCLCCCCR
jgi:hypothetical protein